MTLWSVFPNPVTFEQAATTQLVTIENVRKQLSACQFEAKKTKEDLTKQLVLIEKNLTAKLTTSQQEAKKTKEDLTQQLKSTEKSLTAKLMASQQEAKSRTTDQLFQKLTATEKELNTTKQQLATTCQNLLKLRRSTQHLLQVLTRPSLKWRINFKLKSLKL